MSAVNHDQQHHPLAQVQVQAMPIPPVQPLVLKPITDVKQRWKSLVAKLKLMPQLIDNFVQEYKPCIKLDMYRDEIKTVLSDHNWSNNKVRYYQCNIFRKKFFVPKFDINSTYELQLRNLPSDYCDEILDQLPTVSWFEQQRDYINSLSDIDYQILMSYTYWGDGPVNNFIRYNGNINDKKYTLANIYNIGHIVELFHSTSCEDFLMQYRDRLNFIIMNAPVLDKDILVFRGIKDDIYHKQKHNNLFTNKGFVSTSLEASVAHANAPNICRIRLVKGTKCLCIITASNIPDECEIVLPDNTIFYIHAKQQYLNLRATQIVISRMVVVGIDNSPEMIHPLNHTPLPELSEFQITFATSKKAT
jgi:hypothetical protein